MQLNMNKELHQQIKLALQDKKTADVRHRVFSLRRPKVNAFRANHPEMEVKLQRIKKEALGNLAAYTARAVQQMKHNGFRVFEAKSTEDALRYIDGIITDKVVVKSKSNAVKEIKLIEHLQKKGLEVVETDLGDRICQLGNVNAAHPLGPAVHLPVERVAEIFSNYAGEKLKPDPHELVRWARESLRDTLIRARVAITGANAIAADTGSIVLTENEGNIRMAVSVPRVLVVVAGIEKIVPSLENCLDVVRCAAGFGVGQEIGTYISVVSGLADDGKSLLHPHGPQEVHVVLLRKGRWEILGTPLEKILHCINCGHCLRVCPVFNELGEQYGKPFFGGIGVLKVAALGNLDEAYLSGLDLCMGCRRCTEVCPAGIPTPDLIARVRERWVKQHGLKGVKKYLVRGLKRLPPLKRKLIFSSQWLYSVKNGRFRKARIKVKGRVIIPGLAKKSLTQIYRESKKDNKIGGRNRVLYFPGCMHNHFLVEVGTATIELLQKTGCEVILPREQVCCGYPAIAAGNLAAAREMAARNLSIFKEAGCPVVLIDCPTCQTGLAHYPHLFEREASGWLETSLMLVEKLQYLSTYLAGCLDKLGPLSMPGLSVSYHRPCHLKGMDVSADGHILSSIGDLTLYPAGEAACCGFGGIFSLDFYQLSAIIRRRRVRDLLGGGPEIIVTSCPGCLYHLSEGIYEQGGDTKVFHIAELIRRAVNI
ncbi:LUD domain-containing protein [Desulfallas sp. Bu1-1]|uniref:LUD domain-containing protein n=1 Tax=Desulfallas sp. Bu1-1 TaxID=2787620 RepID=UPI00189F9B98|nr:LUD domain-containing protein [Desulfallas sp. Bu1-1]MBF7083668.1 LUD domain-containing protein [Desulfallas sp. Bu1-1]